jgi:hypothetical protein
MVAALSSRYERHADLYCAFLALAAAIICFPKSKPGFVRGFKSQEGQPYVALIAEAYARLD